MNTVAPYKVDGRVCDLNYLRYVGWDESNVCINSFFSPQTVALISKKVTQLTLGVDEKNRPIIVPDERIVEVMDGVYQGFRPSIGDIYSRFIVPNHEQEDAVQSMIDQTIEIITSNVKNMLEIEKNNKKLTAWVQVYGDFNTQGLRAHSIITTRDRKPTTMQFNMNY